MIALRSAGILALFGLSACASPASAGGPFDLVIAGGRVMDPESGLDAVRDVGIAGGTIRAISASPLRGAATIDARGLVVAPGFIDLHQHGQAPDSYALKAQDGVTSALELEVGTAEVDRWYAEREGKAAVHFGVSIGHIPVRMAVMGDPPRFLPSAEGKAAREVATPAQVEEMKRRIAEGLRRGAVAVGFGMAYTPAASRWEVLECFRAAAPFGASCHVHMRHGGTREPHTALSALEEVLAASAVTGAPLHVVHVTSSSGLDTPRVLQVIDEARARGLDVTTECYVYTAGMTDISSPIFDEGFRESRKIDYAQMLWPPTGERLTAETFAKYRKQGGLVVVFSVPEEAVQAAVAHPEVMIASDGLLENGVGHPRNAGCYARVLGRYVREEKRLTLMQAIRKMSLLPARRLEHHAPMFRDKGRLREGADADVVVFDPATVIDRATYEKPSEPSHGIPHVLVGGVPVVRDGKLLPGVLPGRPLRAPIR